MIASKNPGKSSRATAAGVEQKIGYHHGNLRKALLDGALRLLEEGGIDAVTTRACAGLAGVSPGAIRNHFPDKRALLAGLAANGYELLANRRRAQPVADVGLEAALEVIISNYVGFAVEHSALFRLMFADEGLRRAEFTELHQASREGYVQLRSIFEKAFCHDGLLVHEMDANFHLIWSAMHGIAMLVIDRQFGEEALRSLTVRQRCKQLAQVLNDGLSRNRASSRGSRISSDRHRVG